MPWYLLIGVGFLIGLCISNAYLRHHALTLMIWICKAIRITMSGLIWCFEYLQDRFDDIELPVKQKDVKAIKQEPKTTKGFDFNTATEEQIMDYIRTHPEEVRSKPRGGD